MAVPLKVIRNNNEEQQVIKGLLFSIRRKKMESTNIDFPQVAMNIILSAGNARTKASEALEALMDDDYEKAKKLLNEADEFVKKAHRSQTVVMQTLAAEEYDGGKDPCPIPMIFIHAQDTIMTIMSEVEISKKIVRIYEKLDKEIKECR